MFTFTRVFLVFAGVVGLAAVEVRPAFGQFEVEGHPVQVHGFVTQGFAYSDVNNYLTMETSKGSFAFSDAGLNVSTLLTNRLRVGAQVYSRNIGELGNGHVTLDWALADYRFTDWLGVRAGKVKTVLGLYNDTSDQEFLHTWALLPQSLYPLDLRADTLAHLGGDIYGSFPVPHAGKLSYVAYLGRSILDRQGGYAYGLMATQLNPSTLSGSASGGNLKWTTPISGLVLNASFLNAPKEVIGASAYGQSQFRADDFSDKQTIFSGQYTLGNLRLEGEYSRKVEKVRLYNLFGAYGPPQVNVAFDRRAWYTAAVYRVSKRLELGTYNSRFFPNSDDPQGIDMVLPPAARHIFDQTVAARIDLKKYWDLKIEGHFIDGYGDPSSFLGFYPQNNPLGLQPRTNLLILRTGLNF